MGSQVSSRCKSIKKRINRAIEFIDTHKNSENILMEENEENIKSNILNALQMLIETVKIKTTTERLIEVHNDLYDEFIVKYENIQDCFFKSSGKLKKTKYKKFKRSMGLMKSFLVYSKERIGKII